MGYRKHLNILKRKDWDDYLKGFKKESMYSLDVKNIERVEICSELPLSDFEEMYIVSDEYLPYILTKKDIKIILDFYINRQKELVIDLESIYTIIKESYNENECFKDCEEHIFRLLSIVSNDIINKEFYWKRLPEKGVYIKNTDTYSFQYFYLVRLYEKFNDETDVAIITHG